MRGALVLGTTFLLAASVGPGEARAIGRRRTPPPPPPPAQTEDAAAIASQNIPATLQANAAATVRIEVRNTGTATWTSPDYKLGAVDDGNGDAAVLTGGSVRTHIPQGVSVAPGQTHVFEVAIAAPGQERSLRPAWQMVHEGVRWFGEKAEATLRVTAPPPSSDDAQILRHTIPAQLPRGQSAQVEVEVRNTGSTVWRDPDFKLGSDQDQNGDAFRFTNRVRVHLPNGVEVAPGQTHTFSFRVRGPVQEGTYTPAWRMVHEGVRWFGGRAQRQVEVTGPPPWTEYPQNPFVIPLNRDVPSDADGGIIVADVDDDGRPDFVVSSARRVSAYATDGRKLWERDEGVPSHGPANGGNGYPGTYSAGVFAGDVDGDGRTEVGWVNRRDEIVVVNGANGQVEKRMSARGAPVALIANFRGQGDRDLLLQYDQRRVRGIRYDNESTLFDTTEFISAEHSTARIADLDGDGRDEIIGVRILGPDGRRVHGWDIGNDLGSAQGSVDSVAVKDIIRGGKLEVAIAEQGGNDFCIVVDPDRILFGERNPGNPCCRVAGECRERDPDKVAIGNFTGGEDRLEIFCRSACGRAPWVFDADGNLIAEWVVDQTKPAGWFVDGIEMIFSVDWDGDGISRIAAKERHLDGDAAVIDPMTGRFIERFDGRACRVMVADVQGDSREEVITVDLDGTIKVWWNDAPNPNARPRRWDDRNYHREKQNHNYYSP